MADAVSWAYARRTLAVAQDRFDNFEDQTEPVFKSFRSVLNRFVSLGTIVDIANNFKDQRCILLGRYQSRVALGFVYVVVCDYVPK